MSKFSETQAAADFIATADSRGTSREIMEAIVELACDKADAIRLWECPTGEEVHAIAGRVTGDGQNADANDFDWGVFALADVLVF